MKVLPELIHSEKKSGPVCPSLCGVRIIATDIQQLVVTRTIIIPHTQYRRTGFNYVVYLLRLSLLATLGI